MEVVCDNNCDNKTTLSDFIAIFYNDDDYNYKINVERKSLLITIYFLNNYNTLFFLDWEDEASTIVQIVL